jgi:hypothetical protein
MRCRRSGTAVRQQAADGLQPIGGKMLDLLMLGLLAAVFAVAFRYVHACVAVTTPEGQEHVP